MRREELLQSGDPAVAARALKLFALATLCDRQSVIARYTRNVPTLIGDAGRGKQVFQAQCAACHRPERGERVGPNLATLQDRSPTTLLVSILDPNRDVKPAYVAYVVRTSDRQVLSGVLSNETASGITVRQALGIEETVLRPNIEHMRSTGRSLMPEGLEAGIGEQAMADLLRYVAEMRE